MVVHLWGEGGHTQKETDHKNQQGITSAFGCAKTVNNKKTLKQFKISCEYTYT